MFGLGGGVLVGPQVQTFDIKEFHMSVQYDETLHPQTIKAVEAL
jgi:hypothetical protein